jgi:hypothetical protein
MWGFCRLLHRKVPIKSMALKALMSTLMTVCALSSSHAAESIQLVHSPLDARDLPTPGDFITMSVEVRNSRETNLKVRLAASRDGKLLDIGLPPGAFNESDIPVYRVQLPAPAAVMTYQFVVQDKDGGFTVSDRFVLRRSCIPTYRFEVPANAVDAAFKQEVGTLMSKAKSLEATTQHYENALRLIDDLRGLLNE